MEQALSQSPYFVYAKTLNGFPVEIVPAGSEMISTSDSTETRSMPRGLGSCGNFLRQPFLKLSKEAFSIRSVLKAHHKIVGVANDDDIVLRHFPAPDISPQIEEVMHVHVGDQR